MSTISKLKIDKRVIFAMKQRCQESLTIARSLTLYNYEASSPLCHSSFECYKCNEVYQLGVG